MLTPHQKIVASLKELGYTSGWAVNGTEIEWIEEPDKKPTKKQLDTMIEQIESILEARAQQEKALKISAYTKLGLTEEEINAIL